MGASSSEQSAMVCGPPLSRAWSSCDGSGWLRVTHQTVSHKSRQNAEELVIIMIGLLNRDRIIGLFCIQSICLSFRAYFRKKIWAFDEFGDQKCATRNSISSDLFFPRRNKRKTREVHNFSFIMCIAHGCSKYAGKQKLTTMIQQKMGSSVQIK
jgi:hypothetical protein